MFAVTLVLAFSSMVAAGPDTVVVSPPAYLDALASLGRSSHGPRASFGFRLERGNCGADS